MTAIVLHTKFCLTSREVFIYDTFKVQFQVSSAIDALKRGESIQFENVKLTLNAGGLSAVDINGEVLGGHQAFWFAWSQFYPETALWTM